MGKEETDIIKVLKEYLKKISKKIDIEKVILFGSRARGENREGSDVDIIIVSRDFEGKRYFERPQGFYLAWGKNYEKYEIDIICLTPNEFKQKKRQISIIKEAVKEGIEIK